jgi:type II secretory ATPase GspE/PulE/Tfp pilus assembly ATPase PilB-like protein
MEKIGDILVKKELITAETVKDVLAEQELSLKKFGEILVEKGIIKEEVLISLIAEQNGYEFIPSLAGAKIVSRDDDFYWKNCCILINMNSRKIFVFNTNNADISGYMTALHMQGGIITGLSTKEEIYKFLSDNTLNQIANAWTDNIKDALHQALEVAISKKSPNIRIKKSGSSYLIIIDTDTGVEVVSAFSIERGDRLINVIANQCGDQLKPGLALDAKFKYESMLTKRQVDIRVEFLPISERIDDKQHYESVLRVHGLNNLLDLKSLGFNATERIEITEVMTYSSGLIIAAGPTGAGKSTTFYAVLKELAKKRDAIITIEDPVEIKLNEINITQMSVDKNFRYSEALTTILRCEPKIIMVGEIRDVETAAAVIKAAQTGHLVLTTIHTQSAFGIISRIKGLGVNIDDFLEVIRLATSQRLYLPLCPDCREEKKLKNINQVWLKPLTEIGILKEEERIDILNSDKAFFMPVRGNEKCSKCYGTGYLNKKAVIEVLPFRQNIINDIRNGNVKYETLKDKALAMLKKGEIDISQLFKIAG